MNSAIILSVISILIISVKTQTQQEYYNNYNNPYQQYPYGFGWNPYGYNPYAYPYYPNVIQPPVVPVKDATILPVATSAQIPIIQVPTVQNVATPVVMSGIPAIPTIPPIPQGQGHFESYQYGRSELANTNENKTEVTNPIPPKKPETTVQARFVRPFNLGPQHHYELHKYGTETLSSGPIQL